MVHFLGLLLLSFSVTSILIVPFVNLLYKLKFRRKRQETKDAFEKRTPIFDKLHGWKAGTPVGGGILVIMLVSLITLWSLPFFQARGNFWEIFVILFTFLSFGALGLVDDLRKFYVEKKSGFFGLRFRHKLVIQLVLAFIVGLIFYFKLSSDFIFIHWIGPIDIGPLFIFLATLAIVFFANAFNITDGLDGLSTGSLIFCLIAFGVLAATILDSVLGVFISVWIGSLIAFLYFNVYPARIWLGDVGALSFGATLAVVGLLTGKIIALAVIGGVFVIEAFSSLIQLLSKKYRGKKAFKVAPLHLFFQDKGWEEPKIVMRFWLAGIMFAVLGLWLSAM